MTVSEIQKIRQQRNDQVQQIAGIKQGRFYQHAQRGAGGQLTVYVETIEDRKRLRNIFVHDRSEKQVRLVVSETGLRRVEAKSGEQFVTLLNGRRYDGLPGQKNFSLGSFERYNLRIEPKESEYFKGGKRSAYDTQELLGSDDLQDRAELQDRIGGPLAVITLTLLAIPLTAKSPRQRATGRMFLAFLTYFCFFNLQRLATNWFETGVTPIWLGSLWYQGLIVLLVLGILLPESYWFRQFRLRIMRP
jgi:lipopolysaccharide export system permease protein